MKAPQIILLGLYAMSLGLSIAQHGKERSGKENAWATFIATIILVLLLQWGGFWAD